MRSFVRFVDKVKAEINRVSADGGPPGEPTALNATFELNKIIVGVTREEFGKNWVTNTALKTFVSLTDTLAKFLDGRSQKRSKFAPEVTHVADILASNDLVKGSGVRDRQ